MALGNSPTRYGIVSRTLHWLTALVVFATIPAGLLANRLPYATNDEIARTFFLFSAHKTLGIAALTLGLARIFWSLTQPRPAPLHPERRWETFIAMLTHWILSIGLVVVPLAGWLSHAATSGLAPIWWPFGQSLPLVPQDPAVAAGFGALHSTFAMLLIGALLLHIAGALRHALVDHDATLSRMTSGTSAGTPSESHRPAPPVAAVAIWIATLAAGLLFANTTNDAVTQEPREWPLETAEVTLLDDTGKILGTTSAFSFLLSMAAESGAAEKGTLDIVVPVDAMEGDGVDTALSFLIFPILNFSGTISGSPPELQANGFIDAGGSTAEAAFTLNVRDKEATVSGTLPVPGAPLQLRLEARAIRP